jgi:DNA topoisomerase-1
MLRDEHAEGRAAAKQAGLHHVRPYEDRGLSRKRAGRGFVYQDGATRVRAAATIARIEALVIPPAWRDVWISRDPLGHVQAAGRDARGRLQYRYHDQWRVSRDLAKYDRLIDFCRRLPALRRRIARDLQCPCVCRTSVAAAVVALIERGHLRIGNDEYTRTNHTYGATTLETRHVRVRGAHVELRYRGKSGVDRHIEVEDRELGRAIARVRALPGRRLFQYLDESGRHALTSNDVNAYLHDLIGDEFSAKDFRTWAATLSCALLLSAAEAPTSDRAMRRTAAAAIREVADRLGHTPAVCRKSYLHPRVLDDFATGGLASAFPPTLRARRRSPRRRAPARRRTAPRQAPPRGPRPPSALCLSGGYMCASPGQTACPTRRG